MVRKFLGISAIVLSTCAFASPAKYQSVLPEGARIVAGDLSKNEFYILGKSESHPSNPPVIASVLNSVLAKEANKKMVSNAKLAINQSHHANTKAKAPIKPSKRVVFAKVKPKVKPEYEIIKLEDLHPTHKFKRVTFHKFHIEHKVKGKVTRLAQK